MELHRFCTIFAPAPKIILKMRKAETFGEAPKKTGGTPALRGREEGKSKRRVKEKGRGLRVRVRVVVISNR